MEQEETKMVIVIRNDVNMRKGKMAAQAAHAASKFLIEANTADRDDELNVKLSNVEAEWLFGSMAKVVVRCDSEEELEQLVFLAKIKDIQCHKIIDSGRTEFHGEKTLTCAAFGPDRVSKLDQITGKLKLL